MKRQFASALGLLVVALIAFGCTHDLPSQGWVTLIDGNTGMDNWNSTGSAANWRAEDGAILAGTPEAFGAYIRAEIARWTKVVAETGVKVD